jgi:hypothetical protein
MSITGEQLKEAFKYNPEKTSHVLAETLREFGYASLTDEDVQSVTQRLVDGEEIKDDVIAVFIGGWLTLGVD